MAVIDSGGLGSFFMSRSWTRVAMAALCSIVLLRMSYRSGRALNGMNAPPTVLQVDNLSRRFGALHAVESVRF